MNGTPPQFEDWQWSSNERQSRPLLSVDLWNGKGKERKVAPPGIEPQGLWLEPPALCHWAMTPTDSHPSHFPFYCYALEWLLRNVLDDCCVHLLIIMDGEHNHSLGSIPSGANFLSFPLPFQRSTDSNGTRLSFIRRSLLVFRLCGKSRPSDSPCCDYAHRPLWSILGCVTTLPPSILWSYNMHYTKKHMADYNLRYTVGTVRWEIITFCAKTNK